MVGISNRHADQECGAIGASNFARDACDRMGAWMGTLQCADMQEQHADAMGQR